MAPSELFCVLTSAAGIESILVSAVSEVEGFSMGVFVCWGRPIVDCVVCVGGCVVWSVYVVVSREVSGKEYDGFIRCDRGVVDATA